MDLSNVDLHLIACVSSVEDSMRRAKALIDLAESNAENSKTLAQVLRVARRPASSCPIHFWMHCVPFAGTLVSKRHPQGRALVVESPRKHN